MSSQSKSFLATAVMALGAFGFLLPAAAADSSDIDRLLNGPVSRGSRLTDSHRTVGARRHVLNRRPASTVARHSVAHLLHKPLSTDRGGLNLNPSNIRYYVLYKEWFGEDRLIWYRDGNGNSRAYAESRADALRAWGYTVIVVPQSELDTYEPGIAVGIDCPEWPRPEGPRLSPNGPRKNANSSTSNNGSNNPIIVEDGTVVLARRIAFSIRNDAGRTVHIGVGPDRYGRKKEKRLASGETTEISAWSRDGKKVWVAYESTSVNGNIRETSAEIMAVYKNRTYIANVKNGWELTIRER